MRPTAFGRAPPGAKFRVSRSEKYRTCRRASLLRWLLAFGSCRSLAGIGEGADDRSLLRQRGRWAIAVAMLVRGHDAWNRHCWRQSRESALRVFRPPLTRTAGCGSSDALGTPAVDPLGGCNAARSPLVWLCSQRLTAIKQPPDRVFEPGPPSPLSAEEASPGECSGSSTRGTDQAAPGRAPPCARPRRSPTSAGCPKARAHSSPGRTRRGRRAHSLPARCAGDPPPARVRRVGAHLTGPHGTGRDR